MSRSTWLSLAAGVMLVGTACSSRKQRAYEYMPDMARTPAYKSFSANPITWDGLTLQKPAPNTIARGYQPFHYGATPQEAERAGRELQNPVAVTPVTLAEGKRLYETFCFVCHGARGQGDGPLVPKIPNPPSYTSNRLIAMPDGQIFHVITMGSGKMPSYASQISSDERWRIINYIRVLQRSQGGSQ